jgi:hypothetical protein
MIVTRFSFFSLILVLLGCIIPGKSHAIIVFRDEGRVFTPPADSALEKAWKTHGSWQGGTGVCISPHWFLTALHLGVNIGSFFDLNGKSYAVVESAGIPGTDLALFRVEEEFPQWLELWDESCGSELKQNCFLMGRGAARGQEILLPSGSKPGWKWGESDGKLSWGTNRVEEYFEAGSDLGSLLVWSWDQAVGPDEGTLSSGDSGGGLLLKDNEGRWRLAGVHFDVDPSVGGRETQYSLEASGENSFWAAIHDGRQMWRGVLGEEFREVGVQQDHPAPMWCGATRIGPQVALIRSIIAPGSHLASKYPPRFVWSRRKLEALAVAGLVIVIGGLWTWKRSREAK